MRSVTTAARPICREEIIRPVFVDADHRKRADPAEIVEAHGKLKP